MNVYYHIDVMMLHQMLCIDSFHNIQEKIDRYHCYQFSNCWRLGATKCQELCSHNNVPVWCWTYWWPGSTRGQGISSPSPDLDIMPRPALESALVMRVVSRLTNPDIYPPPELTEDSLIDRLLTALPEFHRHCFLSLGVVSYHVY